MHAIGDTAVDATLENRPITPRSLVVARAVRERRGEVRALIEASA